MKLRAPVGKADFEQPEAFVRRLCAWMFLGAPKSLQMVIAAKKLKDAYSLEGKL